MGELDREALEGGVLLMLVFQTKREDNHSRQPHFRKSEWIKTGRMILTVHVGIQALPGKILPNRRGKPPDECVSLGRADLFLQSERQV